MLPAGLRVLRQLPLVLRATSLQRTNNNKLTFPLFARAPDAQLLAVGSLFGAASQRIT